jgi:hypothetical protein
MATRKLLPQTLAPVFYSSTGVFIVFITNWVVPMRFLLFGSVIFIMTSAVVIDSWCGATAYKAGN